MGRVGLLCTCTSVFYCVRLYMMYSEHRRSLDILYDFARMLCLCSIDRWHMKVGKTVVNYVDMSRAK